MSELLLFFISRLAEGQLREKYDEHYQGPQTLILEIREFIVKKFQTAKFPFPDQLRN